MPSASVLAAEPSASLRECAALLDAGDVRYRSLYRLLRCHVFGSLRQTAEAAGLTEAQTLVGLNAFSALGLICFYEVPFQYTLCEPRKCSLSDSPILGALRALHAREEAREC